MAGHTEAAGRGAVETMSEQEAAEKINRILTIAVWQMVGDMRNGIPAEVSNGLINGILDVVAKIYAASLRDETIDSAMKQLAETMSEYVAELRSEVKSGQNVLEP